MGGTHNKRGKAAAAQKKERKAHAHGGGRGTHRHHGGPSHYRHRHGYLSFFTPKKQNAYQSVSTNIDPFDAQLFDYLIVVDVEATCEEDNAHFQHEIIEFPGVLVDVRCGRIDRERSFHTYVRPVRHPTLSPFCQALTGIRQDQVDHAPTFSEAIDKFKAWFCQTIPLGAKVVLCSDGPWDFKKFFYEHHVLRDKEVIPLQFYEYIDIRTSFSRFFNAGESRKLRQMLHQLGMEFEGREHCGMDDAYNIARVAVKLMQSGCVLDFLVCIPLDADGMDGFMMLTSPSAGASTTTAIHNASNTNNNNSNTNNKDDKPSNTTKQQETTHTRRYYSIPGYPIYRREEGSGSLDRDVVEDIAKNVFGEAYFTFGEQHEKEVWAYRKTHPSQFTVHRSYTLQRRAKRRRWNWWKEWCIKVGVVLLLLVLVFAIYWWTRFSS